MGFDSYNDNLEGAEGILNETVIIDGSVNRDGVDRLGKVVCLEQVDKSCHFNKQASVVVMDNACDGGIGRFSASCFSSSRRGRYRISVTASGSVRRSASIRCCRSQSAGEFLDSSTTSGVTNSGSGLQSDLSSLYSSYALGSLTSSQFSQLASDTTFIDVDLDLEYIKGRELDRARSVGI